MEMKLSVVVPTYRRPQSLKDCLEGLLQQERLADEVIVVTQAGDRDTQNLLATWNRLGTLRVIQLTIPGAVAQYNAGLEAAQGDVVAITDDDAVPRRDWLSRIERRFQQRPDLGGLGGRDFIHIDGVILTGPAPKVGIIQWFGKIVGNHHLGNDLHENVDILKGVNMAFRGEAIKNLYFDADLRGGGAQTCLDMAFSLHVKKRGWRLLYDPAIAVDHYPAPRFDADQRGAPSLEAMENTCFNLYLTLLRHMRPGIRRHIALLWALAVGRPAAPGLLRELLMRFKGDRDRLAVRRAASRAWAAARLAARDPASRSSAS